MPNTVKWRFVAALPELSLREPVEAGSFAIVAPSDARCSSEQLHEEARVKAYLSQFRTVGGEPVNSLLILRQETVPEPASDGLAALRNCLALSVVLLTRANQCSGSSGRQGPAFSDLFDFPAVRLRANGPGLIVETLGVLAIGTCETFCGHPSPTYPYHKGEPVEVDRWLWDALLKLWASEPQRGRRKKFRSRILRALEITYTALRAPSHNFASGNDWGITLGLWVSAFETLARETDASVNIGAVSSRIDNVPWPPRLRRKLAPYDYRSPDRRKDPLPSKSARMTRPVQVYARLYRARNMVLHGEDYERGRLEPGRGHKTWGPLHLEAAVVFRCLLLHVLSAQGFGTYPSRPTAAEDGRHDLGSSLRRRRDAWLAHGAYETALGSGGRSGRAAPRH